MRISDWSSDVCSSDLANATQVEVVVKRTVADAVDELIVRDNGHGFRADEIVEIFGAVGGSWKHYAANRKTRGGSRILHGDKGEGRWKAFAMGDRVVWESRSEEHTSELQSLMRISYAVFCLQKKKEEKH